MAIHGPIEIGHLRPLPSQRVQLVVIHTWARPTKPHFWPAFWAFKVEKSDPFLSKFHNVLSRFSVVLGVSRGPVIKHMRCIVTHMCTCSWDLAPSKRLLIRVKVMIFNTFTPYYSFGEESYLGASCDCTKVSCDIKPSIVWYRHRKRPWLAIIDKGLGSLVFFLMVLQCDKKLSLRLVSVASLTFQVQSTLRHSIGWKNVLRRIGKVWNKMNVLSHHHQTLPIVPYNRRATPASWGPIQVFTGTHFLCVIDLWYLQSGRRNRFFPHYCQPPSKAWVWLRVKKAGGGKMGVFWSECFVLFKDL